jgi:hypothetical protein
MDGMAAGSDSLIPLAEHARAHSLDAIGVVGLRMSDLQDDNLACCGDCRFLALIANGAGAQSAVCARGYLTSLYATWAMTCPDFSVRQPLPDHPQPDERDRGERRVTVLSVLTERRSGFDRRVVG